jgi:mRNA interferase MazF
MVIERFQIWRVDLAQNNTSQLCVVVSPNELSALDTVIVAPMSSKLKAYPSRVACHFRGVDGVIALDQIKAVDRAYLIQHVGLLELESQIDVCNVLGELFAW